MKKNIYILLITLFVFLINVKSVYANIMCNDGTESPTCSDCHQGCCSWHGGCSDSDSGGGSLVTILVGGGGIAAAVAYNKSKKK